MMSEAEWSWRLSEGYSNLVDGARVEAKLKAGPASLLLDTPAALIRRKRPLDLVFAVGKVLKLSGPGPLRLRMRPELEMRCRILFPGNAYLGNFRVPGKQIAVQWDVEGEVEGRAAAGSSFFLHAELDSRLRQTWVRIFPADLPVRKLVRQAWQQYLDPFEPVSVERIGERQILRVLARGRLRVRFGVGWEAAAGWAMPDGARLLSAGFKSAAGAEARFQMEQSGRFLLQLQRRAGKVQASLRRTEERGRSLQFSAGLLQSTRFRVRSPASLWPSMEKVLSDPVSRPLVRSANQQLRRALARKLEIAFAVESDRSRRRAAIVKATWSKTTDPSARAEYAQLLRGSLIRPRDGLKVNGTLSGLSSRRLSVGLHVLDWIRLSSSQERKKSWRLSVTPEGQLLWEKGVELRKRRERWGQVQFLRLAHRTRRTGMAHSQEFRWSYGREGKLGLRQLRQLLRAALHSRAITGFSLPGTAKPPGKTKLSWITDFSDAGIRKVRAVPPQARWTAMVRAFELSFPNRYRRGAPARDWMDSAELRALVDSDPVQAHLSSRYPLSGRSVTQRQHAVSAYRNVKRFLEMFGRRDDKGFERVLKAFALDMDLPVFVFFHLVCPPPMRRSALVWTGAVERIWGDREVLEESPGSKSFLARKSGARW